MTTSTIIEINHEFLGIGTIAELCDLIQQLRGQAVTKMLDNSRGQPVQWGHLGSIRILAQRGHTETPSSMQLDDAKFLRSLAAGLTYNDTPAEGRHKHRLSEISMRIEAGLYGAPDTAIERAAIAWTYCPPQGGYQDGPSIEDCCEALVEAVVAKTHIQPPDDWLTEEQRDTLLSGTPAQGATA